jgi:REP-associated tyrosine transposase
MGREPRSEEPNGIYHVTSRGSNRQAIFLDDLDRRRFLALLAYVARSHGWIVWAYCLITNHYYLIVQIPHLGLSAGMSVLNGGHSRLTNQRHSRTAHLFRNRFGAELIESETHLLEACRYIALNPVRAGLCWGPEEWPWGSYRATVGLDPRQPQLAHRELLALFHDDREAARHAFSDYVTATRG